MLERRAEVEELGGERAGVESVDWSEREAHVGLRLGQWAAHAWAVGWLLVCCFF